MGGHLTYPNRPDLSRETTQEVLMFSNGAEIWSIGCQASTAAVKNQRFNGAIKAMG